MIQLVLRGADPDDDRLLTEQLGGEEGIEVALSTTPRLALRRDLDALLLNSAAAAELLNVRPAREPVTVTVDAATGARAAIYPAVVSTAHPPEPHWWRGELGAAWVVGYASFAAPPNAELEGEGATALLAISDEEADYAIILDALEAMERHNATSAEPKIRRAGMEASANWALGLRRAYREYRARAAAG